MGKCNLSKTIVLLLIFLVILCSSLHSRENDSRSVSEIKLEKGEAAVWYLFHAGWAVKTASALLIFDYWQMDPVPENPSLDNGYIHPGEIKDLDVYVFVSHGHGDHYDRRILGWKKQIPKISYIFGWEARDADEAIYFGKERTSKNVGPLTIKNIYHDFDGIPECAFLVEVDGLTIYFSGDHGAFAGRLKPVFKDNIDYLAGLSDKCDMAFVSVFGSPTYDGELYAAEKFRPRVFFPMHYGAKEAGLEEFIKTARNKNPDTQFRAALNQGDCFFYKGGKILFTKD
jgi:L-ascorbate metabolism protein UlaG (beta-lactamase superfamily)